MQPLYPYFAIYRGPKMEEDFKKYLYSHAQALSDIQTDNILLKEKVGQTNSTCIAHINTNAALVMQAKDNIKAYLRGGEII